MKTASRRKLARKLKRHGRSLLRHGRRAGRAITKYSRRAAAHPIGRAALGAGVHAHGWTTLFGGSQRRALRHGVLAGGAAGLAAGGAHLFGHLTRQPMNHIKKKPFTITIKRAGKKGRKR